VAGVEVGSVTDVAFAGTEVDVSFEVKKDIRPRITDQSIATLGSVSLLGESAVDITPAAAGNPIPDDGYVKAGRAKGSLADVSEQVTTGVVEITGLVNDVSAWRASAGS